MGREGKGREGKGREGKGREEVTRSGTWVRRSYNLRSDQHA